VEALFPRLRYGRSKGHIGRSGDDFITVR